MLQCVAVFCSVLQCVAVCCRVMQCVAVKVPYRVGFFPPISLEFYNVFAETALGLLFCCMLQYVAMCCSMLQRVAECGGVLQFAAV